MLRNADRLSVVPLAPRPMGPHRLALASSDSCGARHPDSPSTSVSAVPGRPRTTSPPETSTCEPASRASRAPPIDPHHVTPSEPASLDRESPWWPRGDVAAQTIREERWVCYAVAIASGPASSTRRAVGPRPRVLLVRPVSCAALAPRALAVQPR
ncbi:hypothetical protein FA09DRAFT_19489 [Tilletiopsis washingtonensis]|uniref:Uncharacterized protein n=1 Tax=Tilletiopsis washingtonensis TaxID=58919 RepID=A0A316Z996_9BASI|nr:hypothetical protein FA09DRAFT_19489 [Tilletiopsis washingtonensis]PWN98161.1 hypothetical protein FA09DRAFT_19489 [Tilletiopsis washingtonensis]